MSEPIAAESDLQAMRMALNHTWYPFFARFSRPTAVQQACWRPLLELHDVLVCSPTASGKTEAILAPLVEAHLPPGIPAQPRILLVCPSRALVNDLLRRIQPPLQALGLRVQRRTGDHATLDRQHPPQILVTTPESLDSLMVRHADFLRDVRAIVLDEVHFLDGTPRGDQLRLLLVRLRGLVKRPAERRLQCVASSATVHKPGELSRRYLEQAKEILLSVPREIESEWVHCPRPADVLVAIARHYGREQSHKILAFVNRRADAEQLASLARRWPRLADRTYVHHGSLSREERERVESRFLEDPSAICFASVTLELGVDIGDVDLVVFVGPPPSVAAFMQRLGRGNRRTDKSRLLGCYRDEGERLRLLALEELARQGELLAPDYRFHPSVLVQQIGSLLLQSPQRWLTPDVLWRRLPPDLQQAYGESPLRTLFEALIDRQWLQRGPTGHYYAGQTLHRAFEMGTLHSNLPEQLPGVDVYDESTGRRLGHIRPTETGVGMALAGRSRTVLHQGPNRLYVRDSGASDAADSPFQPRGRQLFAQALAQRLAKQLAIGAGNLPLIDTAAGLALFHFQGTVCSEILARHLHKEPGWSVQRSTALALHLAIEPPLPKPPLLTVDALTQTMRAMGKRLARLAEAGPFHRWLPLRWQEDFLLTLFDVPALVRTWNSATILACDDPELRQTLLDLADIA